jgi:hypothetical protein
LTGGEKVLGDSNLADSGRARRVLLICAVAGLIAALIRLGLLPAIAIPIPIIQDEFSYLLGADTFAHGRLTNPPHPLWIHFETLHENMVPTYCSKYPPAQAAFLAFGQTAFGRPWYGVVLSMALMFASLCWMLHGWVSPRYAVLATALSILVWGVTTAWINSYWGGAVAATGGALVIGAIPRLARKPSAGLAVVMSIGIVILANSRPFEGALTVIAAALVLLWELRRGGRRPADILIAPVVMPVLLILFAGSAFIGYYNYRTTGNALVFPHVLNGRMYEASPYFYMLPPVKPPVYRHEQIRRHWTEWVLGQYRTARANPLDAFRVSASFVSDFYFYTPMGVAMLVGLFFLRDHIVRAALAIVALPIIGMMCGVRALPHYLAPAFGALLIIAAAGLQRVGGWKHKGRPLGVLLVVAFCSIAVTYSARRIVILSVVSKLPFNTLSYRPRVIDRLRNTPGNHLVIVRYTPTHSVHEEWVYNEADIDGSRIVWAQDMGDRNRELLDYYRDRKAWIIRPDIDPQSLQPYSP